MKLDNSILYKIDNTLHNKKVKIAAFDLDHTLIKPKGGRTFPRDKDDLMLFSPSIIDKLQELIYNEYKIIIFTNQSRLLKKTEIADLFEGKHEFIKNIFSNNNYSMLAALELDHCRKPNTGLFDFLLEKTKLTIDYSNSFFVGDAAGRIKTSNFKKDFSCADRMFAENIGLTFYTPEEFFLNETPRKFIMEQESVKLFPESNANINFKKLMKYNILMLVASPASGKSTLAKRLVSEGYVRINQDELGTKGKCMKKLKELLTINPDTKIVLDNTNGRRESRKYYMDYLLKKEVSVACLKINVSKEQCFFLDNYRCKLEKKKRLPDVVIHTYFKKFNEPSFEEGFKDIITIPFIPEFDSTHDLKIFNQYYC